MLDPEIIRNSASALEPWPLRWAQQTFAALLEEVTRCGRISVAALRTSARTSLTRLSVDDRGRLDRWLALQLATLSAVAASNGLGALATVDPMLSARVRMKIPQVASALIGHHQRATVAA